MLSFTDKMKNSQAREKGCNVEMEEKLLHLRTMKGTALSALRESVHSMLDMVAQAQPSSNLRVAIDNVCTLHCEAIDIVGELSHTYRLNGNRELSIGTLEDLDEMEAHVDEAIANTETYLKRVRSQITVRTVNDNMSKPQLSHSDRVECDLNRESFRHISKQDKYAPLVQPVLTKHHVGFMVHDDCDQPLSRIHSSKSRISKHPFSIAKMTKNKNKRCSLCHDIDHRISDCEHFKALDIQTRWIKVKRHKLCFRCLGSTLR